MKCLGPERWGRTSDGCELNGGSSCAFTERSSSVREIENCCPADREETTSVVTVAGLQEYCEGEVGVSSGDDGLEGILEGDEIGERMAMAGLLGISKPESVKGWKSSSRSEWTEK